VADEAHTLPRRMIGANLPQDAYLTATAAGPSRSHPPDDRWSDDDKAIRLLLNGLRRWAER
jgi:hypothetical protein